jgi:hypothetical protein
MSVIRDLQAAAAGRGVARPLDQVRRNVRRLLEEAPSFRALPVSDRRQIARSMVQVMSYISDPRAGRPEGRGPLAAAQAEVANQALHDTLSKKQSLVGKDFSAGAATAGAKVFKQLVSAVDFPKFVSSLIEGVYTSIVNSSIKQMQAYGKFLEAVVKSAQEFAAENISLDAARDFVVSMFPGGVEVQRGGEGSRLALRAQAGDQEAPDFKTALGLPENVSLDDEESELKVVLAAQLKMAQQRQQQLATMLLMGINRIVVTEGEIKASVLFDVKARDTAQRETAASVADESTSSNTTESGGWFSDDTTKVETSVSTAYSEAKDKSTADLEAKAKLSGSVTVKFKSETFPLERFASQVEMGALQQKGTR